MRIMNSGVVRLKRNSRKDKLTGKRPRGRNGVRSVEKDPRRVDPLPDANSALDGDKWKIVLEAAMVIERTTIALRKKRTRRVRQWRDSSKSSRPYEKSTPPTQKERLRSSRTEPGHN